MTFFRRPTQDADENEAVAARLDADTHGQVMDVWHVLLEQMRKRADARQRFATNLADEMKVRVCVCVCVCVCVQVSVSEWLDVC